LASTGALAKVTHEDLAAQIALTIQRYLTGKHL
jgi:hypothetical protein